MSRVASLAPLALLATLLVGCHATPHTMTDAKLETLGRAYADAWSSQRPELLAACYAPDGSLQVNDADPAFGRDAILATAASYMEAFPDMVVRMESIEPTAEGAVFHWLWTGTNTGPNGTGNAVRLTGHEEWTLAPDGLILTSKGHFDEEEYARQLEHGIPQD